GPRRSTLRLGDGGRGGGKNGGRPRERGGSERGGRGRRRGVRRQGGWARTPPPARCVGMGGGGGRGEQAPWQGKRTAQASVPRSLHAQPAGLAAGPRPVKDALGFLPSQA